MPERRVRVECPFHHEVFDGMDKSNTAPLCKHCGLTMWSHPGTILATLADPAAEALMADGERYAELLAAVRATITKLDAVFRYINAGPITLAHVHGVSYNGPTTEPEYGALKALATTPPAEARNG